MHQLAWAVLASSRSLGRFPLSLGECPARHSPARSTWLWPTLYCRDQEQASSYPKGSASTQERRRGLPRSSSCTPSLTLRAPGEELPWEAGDLLRGSGQSPGPQSHQAASLHPPWCPSLAGPGPRVSPTGGYLVSAPDQDPGPATHLPPTQPIATAS